MNKNFFLTKSEDKNLNSAFLNVNHFETKQMPLNEADLDTLSHNSFDSCKREQNSMQNNSFHSKLSTANCRVNPILVNLKDEIFLNLNFDLNLKVNVKQNEKVNLILFILF